MSIEIELKENSSMVACSGCNAIKKEINSEKEWFEIKDDPVAWQKLFSYYYENYKISHSICPKCIKKFYPEFYKK